jgi:hypothetical protein
LEFEFNIHIPGETKREGRERERKREIIVKTQKHKENL